MEEPRDQEPSPPLPATPADAVDAVRIRFPTRGNRKLEGLLEAANADTQLKSWWHVAQVNAHRLGMSDHSWVHIQIVVNIALRILRLLVRRGVEPGVVRDYGMLRSTNHSTTSGSSVNVSPRHSPSTVPVEI